MLLVIESYRDSDAQPVNPANSTAASDIEAITTIDLVKRLSVARDGLSNLPRR
jgi:hypothetical protein